MSVTRAVPERNDARLLPKPGFTTDEIAIWGMGLFCASEAALFGFLLSSYFFLGVSNPHWPPAGVEDPTLFLPVSMTLLLLSSSIAVHLGERGIKQGRDGRLRAGLAVGMLLGLGFLALQAIEYRDKLKHFRPWSHAYGASFYTVTGFHGAHVAFGVLLMGFTLFRSLRGQFTAHHHAGVTVTSIYWHTVDVVWLAILASLYLSPHWY